MKGRRAFEEQMTLLVGEEAPAFFAALERPCDRAFRYDERKTDEEALHRALGDGLLERVPFGACAFRFAYEGIGAHPLHHAGAIYVQESAAMAPVASLMPRRFRRILDLCAAPGGKSLQAAALLMEDDGELVCNEPDPRRRRTLMQNLERMGQRRCRVTGFDAREFPTDRGLFDLVICDAPCSGEGMVRKSPEVAEEWSRENVLTCAARQEAILNRAARLVAPHGVLLYSTCAWSREENEDRILAFLGEHPCFSLGIPDDAVTAVSRPGLPVGEGIDSSRMRRFYPHVFPGEGQFLAILERDGSEPEAVTEGRKKSRRGKPASREEQTALAAAREFLKDTLTALPRESLFCRGEETYLVWGEPDEESVSPGVLLGEVRKGRIVPHHRFFQAYFGEMKRKFILEERDPRVEAYLRGEEIPLEGEEGWGVLFCGKSPLGGIRKVGPRGKNAYPKGLRKG